MKPVLAVARLRLLFEIVFSFLKFWRATVTEQSGDISLGRSHLKELQYPVDEVALRVKIAAAAEKKAVKKEVKSERRPLIIPL